MEYIQYLFTGTMQLLQYQITIFGFTFSFWNMFLLSFITGIIGWLIRHLTE